MAKYAKILDGKVTKIIEATSEYFDTFIDDSPGQWIETFDDASQRGKFAGIGDTYDGTNDRFVPQKQFNSWVFNEDEYKWEAPVSYPTDGERYSWDEENQTWTQLEAQ